MIVLTLLPFCETKCVGREEAAIQRDLFIYGEISP
jgi:hypothetical protein